MRASAIARRFRLNSHQVGVWILTGAVLLYLAKAAPNFYNAGNLQSVLNDTAILGVGALAMTLLITAGAFDLSVSSIMGLAPIAGLLVGGSYGFIVVLVSILAGAAAGFVNGLIVTRGHVAPFVVTLGTLFVYNSLGAIATNGTAVPVTSPFLLELSSGALWGVVPYSLVILLAVFALCAALLSRFHIGRWIRAVGSNLRASHVNGIDLRYVYLALFTFTGALTGLAGVIESGYLASAIISQAPNYNLSAISAVVVGGTSLRGGEGSLSGTLLAVFLFSAVNNGLILCGVDSYWQYLAIGVVLIVALSLGAAIDGVMAFVRATSRPVTAARSPTP